MILYSIGPIFDGGKDVNWDIKFWMSKLKTQTSSIHQIRVLMSLDNGMNYIRMLIK